MQLYSLRSRRSEVFNGRKKELGARGRHARERERLPEGPMTIFSTVSNYLAAAA